MGCQGTEQRIVDCVSHGMGYSTCRHSFDAGIICEPGNELGLASNNNKKTIITTIIITSKYPVTEWCMKCSGSRKSSANNKLTCLHHLNII